MGVVKEALWVLRTNLWIFLAILALHTTLVAFLETPEKSGLGGFVPVVFEMIIAYVAYTTLLSGRSFIRSFEGHQPGDKQPINSFALSFFGLAFITFFLTIPFIFVLLPSGLSQDAAVIILVAVFLAIAVLLLSLVGTMLPAAIDRNGDKGWNAALKRGKRTFWRTAVRIVAIPGLILAISIVPIFVVPIQAVLLSDNGIHWLTLAERLFGSVLGLLASVAIAVIITQAYSAPDASSPEAAF